MSCNICSSADDLAGGASYCAFGTKFLSFKYLLATGHKSANINTPNDKKNSSNFNFLVNFSFVYHEINKNFNKVYKFIEKPNFNRAKKLIKNNNYLWNSGMFLSNKSALLNEFSILQNKLALQVCDSYINAKTTNHIVALDNKYYSKIKSISFDHAILEKSKNVFSAKLSSDWKDVGSWMQKWEIEKKDKDNNYIKGNILKNNVKNSYISSNRTIVASNLKNVLAVDNNDVLYLSDLKNNNLKNL